MNEAEERIANALYQAIQDESNYSVRSLQSQEFRVGISDIGFCSERVRRMLDQQEAQETDMLLAWIGTALGEHLERAALRVWPDAIIQSEVSIELEGEQRTYTLKGHPDIVLPSGFVLDGKTDYGLQTVRRSGPNDQQQYQRHSYAKAAWEAGMFEDHVALEDVQVGNVWIDRSGIERELHVQLEPYDEKWVTNAGFWLDEVVYAYLQGEEARKEPPREMCAVVCGFYDTCRALDTDVQGLLTSPEVLNAVEMYLEGAELERAGKRTKDQAKVHLEGISGSTGKHLVRWTHVNESVIPETTRRGYSKLDIKPIKAPGRK